LTKALKIEIKSFLEGIEAVILSDFTFLLLSKVLGWYMDLNDKNGSRHDSFPDNGVILAINWVKT
jgi:hypothetical protein